MDPPAVPSVSVGEGVWHPSWRCDTPSSTVPLPHLECAHESAGDLVKNAYSDSKCLSGAAVLLAR